MRHSYDHHLKAIIKILSYHAKHRDTRAFKRGLSKEQVCIPCAINHSGLSLAKISNLGKPTLKDLQNSIINHKIAKGSMFVTDSLKSRI